MQSAMRLRLLGAAWAAVAVACTALPCGAGCEPGASRTFHSYLKTTIRQVGAPAGADADVRHVREEPVEPKSAVRAMLLSALLPGLGEIYVGGRRGYVTGGVFLGIDLVSAYKLHDLNGRGDDLRDEYRNYADRYYSREKFDGYVHGTIAQVNAEFIYCQPGEEFDDDRCDSLVGFYFPLALDDDFYGQIDIDDRFAFGWADWEDSPDYTGEWNRWDPNDPIPTAIETETARRLAYRSMREEADEAYSSADKFAWLMVAGRVISVVDALILTRVHNSRIASLASRLNLSLKVKSIAHPAFTVGVKMRF